MFVLFLVSFPNVGYVHSWEAPSESKKASAPALHEVKKFTGKSVQEDNFENQIVL